MNKRALLSVYRSWLDFYDKAMSNPEVQNGRAKTVMVRVLVNPHLLVGSEYINVIYRTSYIRSRAFDELYNNRLTRAEFEKIMYNRAYHNFIPQEFEK